MKMQQYMKLFPLPADEVDRQVSIKKYKLEEVPRPIAKLEAYLTTLRNEGVFGPEHCMFLVTMIWGTHYRILANHCKGMDGKWIDTEGGARKSHDTHPTPPSSHLHLPNTLIAGEFHKMDVSRKMSG